MTRVCGGTYLCALQRRARAQWRRWRGVALRGACPHACRAQISVPRRLFSRHFFRALFDRHYGGLRISLGV